MDKDGNVWFANSETKSFLGVIRRSTRQYQGFRFEEGGFVRRLHLTVRAVFAGADY